MIKAIEKVCSTNPGVEFILIENVPHSKAREIYAQSDLLIDQLLGLGSEHVVDRAHHEDADGDGDQQFDQREAAPEQAAPQAALQAGILRTT